MKNKKIKLVFCGALILSLFGCGSSKREVKDEYTVSEFIEFKKDLEDAFEKETELWTDEEISEKGIDKYYELAESLGYPTDEMIKIRGYVKENLISNRYFALNSSSSEDSDYVLCFPKTNSYLLSDEISNLLDYDSECIFYVQGTFLNTNKKAMNLNDCEIISPHLDNVEENFESNIDASLYYSSGMSLRLIEGVITSSCLAKDFDYTYFSSYEGYDVFKIFYDNSYDSFYFITIENDVDAELGMFAIVPQTDEGGEIAEGKRIAILGTTYTGERGIGGVPYMGIAYTYYTF